MGIVNDDLRNTKEAGYPRGEPKFPEGELPTNSEVDDSLRPAIPPPNRSQPPTTSIGRDYVVNG